MINIFKIISINQNKEIMHKLFLYFLSIMVIITSLSFPIVSFAYKTDVHKRITYEAIKQNKVFFNQVLNNLGFPNGVDQIIKGFKENPIHEWLQYGSVWEDEIGIKWINPFSSKGAMYNHFFDPLYDLGYYEIEDGQINEIGESLIDRMNDSVPDSLGWQQNHNEWAYQMARKLYYSALTGNSHDAYNYWFMRDKALNMFTGKENMNHTEMEQFFAWTFQALGHVAHLIQDASVPAHTRNDLHADKKVSWVPYLLPNKEPYEEWTVKNIIDLAYSAEGSNPWDLWKNYSAIPTQNTFIDTYPHPEGSTTPDPIVKTDDLNQGLAQYSYANFLSRDSIYVDNPLGHDDLHDLDGIGFSHLGDVINKKEIEKNGKMRSYFYVKNNTTGVDHFALCGLSWSIKQMVASEGHAPVTGILYTVNDDLVSQDYASKLIPRAVGYSAGFLEYFFRGKIDLLINEDHYYFIKNKTDEEMEGIFELYYDNVNDQRTKVPNSPFPLETTISAKGTSGSITFPAPTDAEEPGKYILVFRGRMGNENDAVVGKVVSLSSMIAFQSQPGGPGQGNSNIHIIYPDGTGERQITNSGDGLLPYKYSPAWSPDGTKLAFYTETASSGYDIIVVDMTSKEEYPDNILFRLDAGHDEYDPSFSPDGQKIAAIRHGAGGNDEIIIFNLNTGSWTSLGEVGEDDIPMIGGGAASTPRWSPDGEKIVYSSDPNFEVLKRDIFIIDAVTGSKINITDSDDYTDSEPSWSPDGQYIVFCSYMDGGGYRELWLYDTYSGQYYQLTDFDVGCNYPNFSPDGKKVIFSGYHYAGTPPDEYINYYGIIYLNDIYDGEAGFTILKDPEVLENEPAWSHSFYSPSIDVFEVEPASIPPGGSTTLNWETTNAYSCRIETGSGQDLGCDDLNGSVTVNPSETTTYTITVYGKAGSRVSASVIVTVTQ